MKLNDKEALFALSLIYSPGKPGMDTLLEKYESPAELLEVLLEGEDKYIPHNITAAARAFDMNFASQVREYCENNGIQIFTRVDEGYPEMFFEVDCPPLAFYCAGDSSVLQDKAALTIVGARNSTEYSVKVAGTFAGAVAAEGHTIISGFARGIDSAAHWGAINAGGKTVAVLGCGIHYDYPRGNGELKQAIINNGAVISEYPPLQSPDREYFTIRNRLIAGLAKGVLVVQAGVKSGSLNSASHAISQGKDVFVIPPADIFSEDHKGQSILIRDGAIPVFEPHDILMEL
ncbi:DNA-processing protein DprA [Ruminococcus sp.]|uniref:DNA-processing protein DprA n=1 Tax=Ruminococcus sp. TaxID=41978 RepID=UPI0025D5F58A|nr:DNA-processing protein DprA [Ruminococcus sp.]MBQ8967592.1 DNA-processing protein DprA [Ruminococcus sp.]